ncbi:GNAT family N-acetyltransferase [Paenibacillus sp. CAU 1782]
MIIVQMGNEELKAAAELSDKTFRDKDQSSMADAFPAIFSGALGCSLGCYDGNELISFMGLVPQHISIGAAKLPLMSLGSVCTAEEHRGKGTASLLLQEAFRQMDEAGASLLYVSGDRQLYMRNGCRFFGDAPTYVLQNEGANGQPGLAPGYVVREAAAADLPAVQSIHDAGVVRYNRSIYETGVLLKAQALASIYKLRQSLVVAELDGEVAAYGVLAVPGSEVASKPPFVVEYGGDAAAVHALLRASLDHFSLGSLSIAVPWQEAELHDMLAGNIREDGKNEGTVRIRNPRQLWKQLAPYLIERDEEAFSGMLLENAISEEDHAWAATLLICGEEVRLSRDELTALLFDPEPAVSSLSEDQLAWAGRLLPIPLPYSAALNYV